MLALVAAVAALLLALHFGRATHSGIWFQTFYNTVHVPVFGVAGLLVFLLAGHVWPGRLRRRIVGSAIAIIVLAMISEAAQIATARNASSLDMLVDVLSAGSAVLLFMAIRKSDGIERRSRRILGLAGGLLLLLLLTPLIVVSVACIERNHRFPVLITFDTSLDTLFARPRNADLVRVGDDLAGHRAVISLRNGRWPGVAMRDLVSDWSGYEMLIVDLAVPGEQALSMNIRVHDKSHDDSYDDRYNREFALAPGPNSLRIPIADIETAPGTRRMDIGNISSLVIFSGSGNAGRVFEIAEIRLE